MLYVYLRVMIFLCRFSKSKGARKLFGGYRITPRFCRASKTLPKSDPRSEGPTICMFNHECAQRNGEVVGACMDGFLFGACCQVPGVVDTTLIQNAQKPRPQVSSAYETYGSQQAGSNEQGSSYQGTTGSFYDNASELENDESAQQENIYSSSNQLDDHKINPNQFYVEKESVVVSSASSNTGDQDSYLPIHTVTKGDPYLPPSKTSSYSTEYPSYINSDEASGASSSTLRPPFHAPSSQKVNPNEILTNGEFTHSDITHPAADSVLIEDDLQFSTGYGPSTIYVPAPTQITVVQTTTVPSSTSERITPQKPVFKPKPVTTTTTSKRPSTRPSPLLDNNYVLIETITNNNKQTQTSKRPITQDGFTTNNMASIESIILMLNDTNHGPTYNLYNGTTESAKVTFTSSFGTQKPPNYSTNGVILDKYGENSIHYAPRPETYAGSSTHTPMTTIQPIITTGSGTVINTKFPSSTMQPSTLSYGTTNTVTTKLPSKSTTTTTKPAPPKKKPDFIVSSTSRPIIITSNGTKRPTVTAHKKRPTQNSISTSSVPPQPIVLTSFRPPVVPTSRPPITFSSRPALPESSRPSSGASTHDHYNNEIIITPTRKPGTKWPQSSVTRKPPSTSYVTGPTPPRFPSTVSFGGASTLQTVTNRIDVINSNDVNTPAPSDSYSSPQLPQNQYGRPTQTYGSIENIEQSAPNDGYNQVFVKIPQQDSTVRPHPTVLITPKPTVSPKRPNSSTLPTQKLPSTSYVFSPLVTKRPEFQTNTPEYISLAPVTSNEFDDAGYFGHDDTIITNRPSSVYNQFGTESVHTSGGTSDDRPAFPGYYGPTPAYSTFNIPTSVVDKAEEDEETYTSPNDFVNFPPVRHPNLNMSGTASAVTNDFYMSTPAFVQDDVLKSKMNLLVNKIVASLQGNFEALANLVEEDNNTIGAFQAQSTTTGTAKPTIVKRPQSTTTILKTTKVTTKRPQTKPTNPNRGTTGVKSSTTTKRPHTKKPAATKTTLTKKPVTRRPQNPTKRTPKPTPKPTKKVAPTTTTVQADELETVEENQEENEIEEEESEEGSRKLQCGFRPHVKSGRIVGGKGATFGEWPWQVLVRESTWLGLFTKNKCGGVLITNKFVMTAAHCQPGFLASLVAVFGEFDISGDLETKRSVTKNVKRVIVHRQYDAGTFENDLALLELESAINYDTHIVPICMPPDVFDFTGRMATVTGWGRLKYGGGVPSVLQEVQVPIIENSVCQEMFHTAGHNKKILPSFLCAGYANGQKDSCEGDSGGPLVLQRPDGRWELAGTVSHGIKCAAPYLPGVYMRTTFYKPWLKQVTGVK